jgi:hypothetical protein
MRRWFSLLAVLAWAVPGRAADMTVDYLRDVKPILAQHCYACHGVEKQRSGLRLDTAVRALAGGNSGAAIVPGKSSASRLIQAVTGQNDVKLMPPKEPRLEAKEIALLKAWIDQGAKAPANEAEQKPGSKSHWSFIPPRRAEPPAVKNKNWVRNPIDAFVLARLEKMGLAPAPEADKITLIRRLHLDLIGLPPSPKEVDDFLADTRPDAYERVVDRLLASPHYGERMARLWLDVARYADSNGFNIDAPRVLWPWRDWVIDAFNRDLPFDQFTIEQLAGDLLPNATREQKIATGFHRNTLLNQEGGIDLEQFRNEYVVDRVNTTGSAWLGLTVGCAQCHDHKFDPITQQEYYQLFAFFNSSDELALELPTSDDLRRRREYQAKLAELEKQRDLLDGTTEAGFIAWEDNLTTEAKLALPEEIKAIMIVARQSREPPQTKRLRDYYRSVEQVRFAVGTITGTTPIQQASQVSALQERQAVARKITQHEKSAPKINSTLVMQERKTPRMSHVHLGGDFLRKGRIVTPGVPAVLPPLRGEPKGPTRLDFARWLIDPAHPLTSRVAVNRYWQHFFGLGLVETENDFGTQGTPPTHPELLDWLACEFVAERWSVKSLHRLIVTSAAYRQASRHRPEQLEVDARNRLLARQNRLRLDAEIIRDSALTASGLLSRTIGGPGVFPPQPEGVYAFTQLKREWKTSTGADRYRRGMYTFFWRSAPHPGLTVFDAPESTTTCTRRNRSNTPLQALTLLNDEGFLECAQALARRVLSEPSGSDAERIRHAFRLALARSPSERESTRLARLLERQRASFAQSPDDAKKLTPAKLPPGIEAKEYAAWTMLARVLLNLDEFITRE